MAAGELAMDSGLAAFGVIEAQTDRWTSLAFPVSYRPDAIVRNESAAAH
jgi:hypothetical protein